VALFNTGMTISKLKLGFRYGSFQRQHDRRRELSQARNEISFNQSFFFHDYYEQFAPERQRRVKAKFDFDAVMPTLERTFRYHYRYN